MRRAAVLALLAGFAVMPARAYAPAGQSGARDAVRRGSASLHLAFALQRVLEPGRNLVVSPLSIQQAFAMADAGTRGPTRRELEAALRLRPGGRALHAGMAALQRGLDSGTDGGRLRLDVANAVWAQTGYPIRSSYLATLRAYYGATPADADFRADPEAARTRINDWAAERTAGRITNLFGRGDVTPLTRLVLANAVYLKATWKDAFDPAATRDEAFRPLRGPPVQVPMMHRTGRYPWVRRAGYTAIELPYTGERLAMLVVIPDAGRFAAVARDLDARGLAATVAALRTGEVGLALPRFTLRSDLDLKAPLQRLGVRAAFEPGAADFSGLSPQARADRLHIAKALQKAFVQVDETGTEAAAVTGVGVDAVSAPPSVVADRPFLFVIRDRPTGAALFLGRVLSP
jgi:serpin B